MTEDRIIVKSKGTGPWHLELTTDPGATLPFTKITSEEILASMSGKDYGVYVSKGEAVDISGEGAGKVLKLLPHRGSLELILLPNK